MIKNNLAEIMKQKNISIVDLAKKTGISRIALASIKYDKTKGIEYKTLDALCRCLKCDITDLLKVVQ